MSAIEWLVALAAGHGGYGPHWAGTGAAQAVARPAAETLAACWSANDFSLAALKPYGERVRANAAFLSALLSRVGRDPAPLKTARVSTCCRS